MKKLFAILTFAFLTACAVENPPHIIGITQDVLPVAPAVAEEIGEAGPMAFEVFFRSENAVFGMYEPAEGAYAAAWLVPGAGIRAFEYASGMRHAVYVSEIFLGDELDVSWLLHCITSLATPMFIVHPPENPELGEISEMELTAMLARRLGSFNLPMFVVFFPEHDFMAAEFVHLFRAARNVFAVHAPHAAFVWAAPCYTATPWNAFYPGHNAVDWVALPMLAEWSAEGGFTEVLPGFERFYDAFHEHKPIMVLPLGVSHFTRGDYTYRIDGAAAEIARIYAALANFPRVGLIAYADAFTISRMYRDDFSVSFEPNLILAYGEAVSGLVSSLERGTEENSRWVRSAHRGYFWDENIFISPLTLETELQIPTPPHQLAELNNQLWIPADVIRRKNIFACEARRVIFVDNLP